MQFSFAVGNILTQVEKQIKKTLRKNWGQAGFTSAKKQGFVNDGKAAARP
jgi:hypothetical protein